MPPHFRLDLFRFRKTHRHGGAPRAGLVLALASLLLVGCAGLEGKGDDAAERGDWDAAVALYASALAEDGPDPDLTAKLMGATASAVQLHKGAAAAREAADDLAASVAEWKRVLALAPTDAQAKRELARVEEAKRRKDYAQHLRDGQAYEGATSPGLALRSYRLAEGTHEDNAEARAAIARLEPIYARADARRQAGEAAIAAERYEDAKTAFAEALAIWPDHQAAQEGQIATEHWLAYGSLLTDARTQRADGDLEGAWDALQDAIGHRFTEELQTELQEVGGELYPGAIAAAREVEADARRRRSGSLEQEDGFKHALVLYDQAIKYQRTREAKSLQATVANDLAKSLVQRAQRAMTYLDPTGAMEALTLAERIDQEATTAVAPEVRYQEAMWEGYDGEASGDGVATDMGYKRAWGSRENAETEAAIARIDKDTSPASVRSLVLADRGGRGGGQAEVDLRQRYVVERLRAGAAPTGLSATGLDVPSLGLGAGIDAAAMAGRGEAIRGAARDASRTEGWVVVTLDSRPGAGQREAPYALRIAPADRTALGAWARATADEPPAPLAAAGQGFVVKVRVRYEAIRTVRALDGATPAITEPLDAAEWQERAGTHAITSVELGAQVTAIVWKPCRSEQDYATALAQVRGLLGAYREGSAPIARLDALCRSSGYQVAGPFGAGSGAADAKRFAASFDRWAAETRAAAAGNGRGVVRAILTPLPAALGLTDEPAARLEASIARRLAWADSDRTLAAQKRSVGEAIDTAAALEREAAAAAAREIAARIRGQVPVNRTLAQTIDLRDARVATLAPLKGFTVWSPSPVEVLLVPEGVANGQRIPGSGRDFAITEDQLRPLRRGAVLKFDGRRTGSGREVSPSAPVGRARYRLIIVHYGRGTVNVRYSASAP